MNKTSESIELLLHNVVDKVAKVAVGIAKAAITLICLGGSLAYEAGYKTGVKFYKETHNFTRNSEVKDDETPVSCEQELNNSLTDAANATEENVDICQNISIVKPVVKTNSIKSFIKTGLRDTLETNLLELTSYNLPKNKRVKTKTHVRHKDLGVLKQYYPVFIATGVLH